LTIFFIVMCIGLSIVAYGVINHTDLIFDENETLEPIAEGNENETTITSNLNSNTNNNNNNNNSKNKSKSNLNNNNSDKLYNQISVNDKNQLRQRLKTTSLNIKQNF
jgi:hypothetical protein